MRKGHSSIWGNRQFRVEIGYIIWYRSLQSEQVVFPLWPWPSRPSAAGTSTPPVCWQPTKMRDMPADILPPLKRRGVNEGQREGHPLLAVAAHMDEQICWAQFRTRDSSSAGGIPQGRGDSVNSRRAAKLRMFPSATAHSPARNGAAAEWRDAPCFGSGE